MRKITSYSLNKKNVNVDFRDAFALQIKIKNITAANYSIFLVTHVLFIFI